MAFAYMDNDQLIKYFKFVELCTSGYLRTTVSANNGRMEFQVFERESLDIMTLAMPLFTFLIRLFIEFCLARSLSGKHQCHADINASVAINRKRCRFEYT
jgi:hypothetical protein